MRDINLALRTAYIEALTTPAISYNGNPVPVWYGEIPDGLEEENYIIIGQISNDDASCKYKNGTDTTIMVAIHTYSKRYNNGDAADYIAGEVLKRIIPADKKQIDLSASNLTCITTELDGDFTQDYSQQGVRQYIDRSLTIRHKIFQG